MTQNTWSQDSYIKAYRFAAHAHQGQTVPGTDLPYLMHLSFVAMEVIAAFRDEDGHDENLAVQCALLHDVIEDTPASYGEVEKEFGPAVAAGVLALSKDPTVEKERQMAESLLRIRRQPPEIWMVKLADRITNLNRAPYHWTKEKVEKYQQEAREILAALGGASDLLAKRLNRKIETYHLCV